MRTVSIVVPTHHRAWHLRHCLNTIFDVCLPPDPDPTAPEIEVLTVHGPDDGESLDMVRECFPQVRVIESTVRNLSTQRNLGAQAAAGDWIVYLDDDAWPGEGWLENLLAPFDDPEVAVVGGRVLNPDGTLQLGRLAISAFGTPIALNGAANCLGRVRCYATGGNAAVRKKALLEIGGFDENINYHLEDGDLSWRLVDRGFRVEYRDDATIYHQAAEGPHRRSYWDRDWRTVVMHQIYFAFQHVQRGRFRLAFVPVLLQIPKTIRFVGWMFRGRLGPLATLRCVVQQWRGVVAGYVKSLGQKPRLPLSADGGRR